LHGLFGLSSKYKTLLSRFDEGKIEHFEFEDAFDWTDMIVQNGVFAVEVRHAVRLTTNLLKDKHDLPPGFRQTTLRIKLVNQ
jgi:hypothetical protein